MPLVAPPTASFTPPLLNRLTDAPLPPLMPLPPLPPIAVPDTVTVPPVAELPKTAGPTPPLERVAEPPLLPERTITPIPAGGDGRDCGLLTSNTSCLGIRVSARAATCQFEAATASSGAGCDRQHWVR